MIAEPGASSRARRAPRRRPSSAARSAKVAGGTTSTTACTARTTASCSITRCTRSRCLDRERAGARPSVLAGPTCDSIDVVREDIPLPELQIGDLVVGRMMGAYTACSATDFNFIPRARIVAAQRAAGVDAMQIEVVDHVAGAARGARHRAGHRRVPRFHGRAARCRGRRQRACCRSAAIEDALATARPVCRTRCWSASGTRAACRGSTPAIRRPRFSRSALRGDSSCTPRTQARRDSSTRPAPTRC